MVKNVLNKKVFFISKSAIILTLQYLRTDKEKLIYLLLSASKPAITLILRFFKQKYKNG